MAGALVRTTLTQEEWDQVKQAAKRQDLNAAQLVSRVIRQHILGKKRIAA